MSLVLGVKIFAAPALIGLASLAGKRWGPSAAGLMGGLPLVGGPVVLALWMAHGGELATRVSLAAPAGVWATIVYLLSVGYTSARWPWYVAIPFGWVLYISSGLLLNAAGIADSSVAGFAVLLGLLIAVVYVLPRPQAPMVTAHLPRIELAARMLAAVALVLTLTTAAAALGPELTGIFSGAPVAATVIPAFTLAKSGRDPLLHALRGFLTGLTGFAVFFLVLGYSIPVLGALALLPALAAAAMTGWIAIQLIRRMLAS